MADLAHELRNPAASIEATVEALADGVLPPDAETLDPLAGQAHRLTRLTDDLQAVSRAEEGSFRLTLDTVDLVDVAHASASSASQLTLNCCSGGSTAPTLRAAATWAAGSGCRSRYRAPSQVARRTSLGATASPSPDGRQTEP